MDGAWPSRDGLQRRVHPPLAALGGGLGIVQSVHRHVEEPLELFEIEAAAACMWNMESCRAGWVVSQVWRENLTCRTTSYNEIREWYTVFPFVPPFAVAPNRFSGQK